MSLCKECIRGVRHEGTPTGRVEDINGVNTYIALPEGDFPSDKAVLFLPDVFGYQATNNKLLAEDFAKNGFQVYIPDYFSGEPFPEEAMTNPSLKFDREKWVAKHSVENSRVLLDKAIVGLRERGITTFAATGYCFGAAHVFHLAQENIIKLAAVAHASRLKSPEDFLDLVAKSHAPLLINSCETDPQFPPEFCQKADEILGDGKYKPGYERKHWMGCTHGFAVRGDVSNTAVKAGKEGAFKATVELFLKL